MLQKQFCIQHEHTYAENKHYQQKWHKEQYEAYRGVNEVVSQRQTKTSEAWLRTRKTIIRKPKKGENKWKLITRNILEFVATPRHWPAGQVKSLRLTSWNGHLQVFVSSLLFMVCWNSSVYSRDVLKCGKFVCVGVAYLVLHVRPWVNATELSEDDVDVSENVIWKWNFAFL